MANEKVTITISAVTGLGPTVGTRACPMGASRQVDLFVAAEEPASHQAAGMSPSLPDAEKTPPEAATPAAGAKKPWEGATERGKGLNFQPDELLHAKMVWVCDNVPKMSRLRILRDGAMAECDRLIALHYKDSRDS